MRRMARLLVCLAAWAMASSTAMAAVGDVVATAASTSVQGVYLLTFDLGGATQMPAGATLNCRARIIPNLPGGDHATVQPAVAGTTTELKPKCRVEVPFSWIVTQPQSGALLSYQIEAVSANGMRVWSTAQDGIGVAYPAAGATLQMDFKLTF